MVLFFSYEATGAEKALSLEHQATYLSLLLRSSGSGEMADTQVLGTCVFGRAGSSPASRTQ